MRLLLRTPPQPPQWLLPFSVNPPPSEKWAPKSLPPPPPFSFKNSATWRCFMVLGSQRELWTLLLALTDSEAPGPIFFLVPYPFPVRRVYPYGENSSWWLPCLLHSHHLFSTSASILIVLYVWPSRTSQFLKHTMPSLSTRKHRTAVHHACQV
jgi:hypothetical protein